MYKVIFLFGVPEHCLTLSSSLQEKHTDKLKNIQRRSNDQSYGKYIQGSWRRGFKEKGDACSVTGIFQHLKRLL